VSTHRAFSRMPAPTSRSPDHDGLGSAGHGRYEEHRPGAAHCPVERASGRNRPAGPVWSPPSVSPPRHAAMPPGVRALAVVAGQAVVDADLLGLDAEAEQASRCTVRSCVRWSITRTRQAARSWRTSNRWARTGRWTKPDLSIGRCPTPPAGADPGLRPQPRQQPGSGSANSHQNAQLNQQPRRLGGAGRPVHRSHISDDQGSVTPDPTGPPQNLRIRATAPPTPDMDTPRASTRPPTQVAVGQMVADCTSTGVRFSATSSRTISGCHA